MAANTHLVAVVDANDAPTRTLGIAKDAVADGGRATFVLSLGQTDQGHIRAFAASEGLAYSEAEAAYIDATLKDLRARVGADVAAVVTDSIRDGRAVMASALGRGATSVAIPSRLARRRGWKRAMAHTPVPVIVSPDEAG